MSIQQQRNAASPFVTSSPEAMSADTLTGILELRRGLSYLGDWTAARRGYLPNMDQVCSRVSQLEELLENLSVRLEEQDREHAQLKGLAEVSWAVNSTLDLDLVLSRAMDLIVQVTRAERGFLMLVDETTGKLSFQIARNMDRDTIACPKYEVSRSIAEHVAATGQVVVTTDALRDPRFSEEDSVVGLCLRSILCNPLQVRGRVIGVVYVDNRLHVGQFQDPEINALRAFADQAAIAIDNARLFASVRQKMQEIAALKTFQDNVFASIPSGVITTDLEDCITALNPAAEMILEIPSAQSVGRHFLQVLAPIAGITFEQLVESVKRNATRVAAVEIQAMLPGRGNVSLGFSVSGLRDAAATPQGLTIVVDDLTDKRRLEATREMFRRYVSPAVVDRLPENPDQLKLGGQRQEITILFADIRGFTHLSESLPPEELVEILNEYLAIAADAILKYEGTLDKFMGDSVMAIFNAPLPQEQYTLRAARAALEMCAAVSHMNRKYPEAMRLNYGIGIHTGEAVVGNVGTQQQMNFTAIGDAVNLAKRLQENARGGQILLSDHAYTRVRTLVHATRLASLKVKGREKIERVWQLERLRD